MGNLVLYNYSRIARAALNMPLTEKYVTRAREILQQIARKHGSPIFYCELTSQLGIATQAAGGVLIPISDDSFRTKRVLLSALVVSKSNNLPSQRFFEQAAELGAMGPKDLRQVSCRAELQRVYDAYDEAR
jgi:hypothetical protein